MKPIVAVVGRPNVGKSTFFNRVTRSRDALVDDMPGVTRDRIYGDASWGDLEFTLIDTGGFAEGDDDAFAGHIRTQVNMAIEDADAVILMLDGKGGISPYDRDLVQMLRSSRKPVLYVVNKVDGEEQEHRMTDFYSLGIDTPLPVSAEHGYGMSDFLDALVEVLPPSEPDPPDSVIRVAVVGRPNAGKSSLINRVLGKERHLVSDVPGTTRDAVDSFYEASGRQYCFIDTAGIRRKGKVSQKIEKFSIIKSLRSLDRCDIALILIDSSEGVTDQDVNIAGYAQGRGCGVIFLLNKWDLVEKEPGTVKRYMEDVKMAAKFLNFAPIITISALTGQRVNKIFKMIDAVYEQYTTRISTGQTNRILKEAVEGNEPPMHKGRRLKFYYATQVAAKPPSFVCFVNFPDGVHFSYQRYLTNQFREGTSLDKTPIRLILRQRTGHIDFAKRKGKRDRKIDKRKRKRR